MSDINHNDDTMFDVVSWYRNSVADHQLRIVKIRNPTRNEVNEKARARQVHIPMKPSSRTLRRAKVLFQQELMSRNYSELENLRSEFELAKTENKNPHMLWEDFCAQAKTEGRFPKLTTAQELHSELEKGKEAPPSKEECAKFVAMVKAQRSETSEM